MGRRVTVMDQDFRKWPPGTLMLLATLEADEASGRDLTTWSVDALAAGFDSPSLRRTAAFSNVGEPSRFDVEPHFRIALRELGVPALPRDVMLLAFLDERAGVIAGGAPDVEGELDLVHRLVVNPLDHRADVAPWCYASERIELGNPEPMTDDDIRAFARRWLSRD
jgi:hypothetical protein